MTQLVRQKFWWIWMGLFLSLAASAFADDIRQIPLQTNDLVFDPVRQRIYASVPGFVEKIGNSIAVIDPVAGSIEKTIPVGSEPNKLALSDDGHYLYVGLDGAAAVQRIDLTTQTPDLQFAPGNQPLEGPLYVEDMEVMPGHPETVAISRRNKKQNPGNDGVAIYDNGVPRPKTTPDLTDEIEFGAQDSRLYGYNNETSEFGFRRLTVDNSGVTLQDVTDNSNSNFLTGFALSFKYEGGLIFTTSGLELDPETRKRIGKFPGASGPVRPDLNSGRVFFATGSGSASQIQAFDPHTFLLLGSLNFLNAMGSPASLIRWGQDGLAFRTDGGQVFLARSSSLIPPPGATADLSITQKISPDPAVADKSLTYSVTVANVGTKDATKVILGDTLPQDVTLVSATSPQGGCVASEGVVTCNVGTLNVGATVVATLVVKPTVGGIAVNQARVSGYLPDADNSNNVSTVSTTVQLQLGPDGQGQLRLTANDLVYDSFHQRIYASVPGFDEDLGNSIAVIDPVAGSIEKTIPVGSEPNKLALSDDGHYLYAGLDGAAAVQRIDLTTQILDLQFPVGTLDRRPLYVGDMAVMPGHPETVAIARYIPIISPGDEGIAIYDNGVPRPRMSPVSIGPDRIKFGAAASRLYGYYSETSEGAFYRMVVDASGVTIQDTINSFNDQDHHFGGDFKYEDGLVFSSAGLKIDPEAQKLRGIYQNVPDPNDPFAFFTSVEPDSVSGRVFFLQGQDTPLKINSFDILTQFETGSVLITGAARPVYSLIRWGQDGLAFRTDKRVIPADNRVYLVRTSLVPTSVSPADLQITQAGDVNPIVVGANLSYTLTVTNASDNPAKSVIVSDTLPGEAGYVSSSTSSGSCTPGDGEVGCALGDLAPHTSATIKIVVSPVFAGIMMNTAKVSGNEVDPDRTNNASTLSTTVQLRLGSDSQGQIRLSANDLIYDSFHQRIYASVPGFDEDLGNSIAVIDPVAGSIEKTISVGSEPNKLALSDDGHYLYVGLDGAAAVRRVDLTTQTPDIQFALGDSLSEGPMIVEDMEVMPGHPETVAISRRNHETSSYHEGVAIYDNGVPRPHITPRTDGANVIEFGATDSVLYGYGNETSENGFYRMVVDDSGVKIQDVTGGFNSSPDTSCPDDSFGIDMKYDRGRIYSNRGKIIDPEGPTVLGRFQNFPTFPDWFPMIPDSATGRVFFLTAFENPDRIIAYLANTFDQAGSLDVPGVNGNPSHLILWGRDGFAFTNNNHILLLRSSLVPFLYGDLDGDHRISATDVQKAIQFYLGVAVPTQEEMKACDLRPYPGTNGLPIGDGRLDGDDLNPILRLFLQLDPNPEPS